MNTEQQSFEKYSEMYKPFQEMFFNWPKSMCSMASSTANADMWFKPYYSYFGNRNGFQEQYTKALSAFFQPFNASPMPSQAMLEGFEACLKNIEVWYKNANKLGRTQCELIQGLFAGKEVNLAEFFQKLNESYDDFSKNLMDSLEKTKPCSTLN